MDPSPPLRGGCVDSPKTQDDRPCLQFIPILVSFTMLRFILPILCAGQILLSQPLHFQRIGTEQGLPQSTVHAILQDRQGFMWFGTWDGLVRYDGYSFLTYKHNAADSQTLSNNNILQILQVSDGSFWIRTQNGLNNFNPITGKTMQFFDLPGEPGALEGGYAYAMCEDHTGTLWIGTESGLHRYRRGSNDFIHYKDCPRAKGRPRESAVAGIAEDSHGRLWLTMDGGIVRCDSDRAAFHLFRLPVSKEAGFVRRPLIDRNGYVWLMSANSILRFDPRTNEFQSVEMSSLPGMTTATTIMSQKFDREGRLWLLTTNGIFRISWFMETERKELRALYPEHFVNDPNDPVSLSNNVALDFYEDRSGISWIGTSSGLNKLLPQRTKFTIWKHDEKNINSLSSRITIAILEEGEILWFGTYRGLERCDRTTGKFTRYDFQSEQHARIDDAVFSIFRDSKRRMWVGTRRGFYRFDEKAGTFCFLSRKNKTSNTISPVSVHSICEDDAGLLWLASWDQLRSYDPGTDTFHSYSIDGLRGYVLYATRGRDSTLWLSMNGTGLCRFSLAHKSILQRYQHNPKDPNSLSHIIVMYAFEDSTGTVWIGTLGGGLDRLTFTNGKAVFRNYDEKDGLPNNNIYGILPDRCGNLWISTNNGISRFNPHTEQFKNYDVHDGLPSNEMYQNGFHLGKSGKMYFGSTNGVIEFYPEEITDNDCVPPVAVTKFLLFGKDRSDLLARKEIVLNHTENYFTIEFAALCYEAPEKNHYAYKMEGLQHEWIGVGNIRSASYTFLNPGEYVFRVKGSNNDGVWNEEGASLRIVILPPWWATWWFRSVLFLLCVGLITGSVRYTIRRKYLKQIAQLEHQKEILEERQKTRDRIARDLHDDLASTVGSAGLFIESAKRTLGVDAGQAKEYLDKTGSLLSEAEEAMSDIVWSVSPKNDTMQSLATRMKIVTTDLCRSNGIAYAVTVTGELNNTLADDLRQALYLIFKEALNNCIKHAQPGKITVELRIANGSIAMTIEDDGSGFAMESAGEKMGGNGMHNMRKRAQEVGAHLEIRSAPGGGTRLTVARQMTQ